MNSAIDRENLRLASERADDVDRFLRAIARIDSLNNEDPKKVTIAGESLGYELHFSRLLLAKALAVLPKASEAFFLAARGQHICRWKSARSDYPEGRAGYLKWRSDLKRFHAETTADVLESEGYIPETIEKVRGINLKKDLRSDKEAQAMEDALCLVFLESQFAAFRHKTTEEKMISILRKTWGKMSDRGKDAALSLQLGEEESRLVQLALKGD
jgi:hypothetical protein